LALEYINVLDATTSRIEIIVAASKQKIVPPCHL
jgi:hypothetical protein